MVSFVFLTSWPDSYPKSSVLRSGWQEATHAGNSVREVRKLKPNPHLDLLDLKSLAMLQTLEGRHSKRSVVAGSTCAARREGKYAAAADAKIANTIPPM